MVQSLRAGFRPDCADAGPSISLRRRFRYSSRLFSGRVAASPRRPASAVLLAEALADDGDDPIDAPRGQEGNPSTTWWVTDSRRSVGGTLEQVGFFNPVRAAASRGPAPRPRPHRALGGRAGRSRPSAWPSCSRPIARPRLSQPDPAEPGVVRPSARESGGRPSPGGARQGRRPARAAGLGEGAVLHGALEGIVKLPAPGARAWRQPRAPGGP